MSWIRHQAGVYTAHASNRVYVVARRGQTWDAYALNPYADIALGMATMAAAMGACERDGQP